MERRQRDGRRSGPVNPSSTRRDADEQRDDEKDEQESDDEDERPEIARA